MGKHTEGARDGIMREAREGGSKTDADGYSAGGTRTDRDGNTTDRPSGGDRGEWLGGRE